MKLFLQKHAKFSSAGGSAPRPSCLRRLGALPPNPHWPPAAGCSTTPNTAPHMRISGYAPAQYSSAVSHKKCVDLIEHQVKCLLECSFITLLVTVC